MKYLLLIVMLSGCGLMVDKPNNAAAFTSDQILNLAVQVEKAQSEFMINEEDGDKLLLMLLKANRLLGGTLDTFNDIETCATAETKFQCIDSILSKVQGAL